MTRTLVASLLAFVAAGCAVDEPPAPTGGSFDISVDSLEISAPGEARVLMSIADTTKPVITTTGPLSATLEVSGSISKMTTLVIESSGPGVGYVKLANDRSADSVKVVATAVSFRSVVMTYGYACGLAADDRAWCWGANGGGQIGQDTPHPCYGGGCQYGDGGSARLPLPARGNRKFASLAAGGAACDRGFLVGACGTTCGVTSQGETYCWGSGFGPAESVRVGPDRSMKSVSVGVSGFGYASQTVSTCGPDSADAIYCLSTTGSTRAGGTMTFSSFSNGPTHSCGISGGDVYCWGSNAAGALGIGSVDSQQHPTPEKAVSTVGFTAVTVGSNQTCALGADQKLYCWGLKFPGPSGFQPSPIEVGAGASYTSVSLAPGASTSSIALCATRTDGVIHCWTTFGGTAAVVQTPVALDRISVGGVPTSMSVKPDIGFGCGLSASNETYCWKTDFVAKKLGAP